MDANFSACLDAVLANEGGFSDDVSDPGGATNLGITLTTLSAWRGSPQTIADVEGLTKADVGPIYRADYWNLTGCQDWPPGVDLMVFDTAVNEGPGRAVRTLQTAVSVKADGLIGPATKAAVAAAKASALIEAMANERIAYYESLPGYPRFGVGWVARVQRTALAALEMAA